MMDIEEIKAWNRTNLKLLATGYNLPCDVVDVNTAHSNIQFLLAEVDRLLTRKHQLKCLPDCSMPDGAEPCNGFINQVNRALAAEARVAELERALECGKCNWQICVETLEAQLGRVRELQRYDHFWYEGKLYPRKITKGAWADDPKLGKRWIDADELDAVLETEHYCGAQGFDGMKGDKCPACEQEKE